MKQKKIRICFFITAGFPLFSGNHQQFGGAEVDLYFLATELAKDPDYEVTFLTGDYGQPDVLTLKGVHLRKVKYFSPVKRSIFTLSVLETMKFFLFNSFDIFITKTAHSARTSWFLTLLKLLKIKKTLYIFRSAHVFDVNGVFNTSKNLSGFLHRFCMKYADKILVQTEEQKEMLCKSEKLPSDIIPNAFPENRHLILPYSKRKYFLWVGSAKKVKQPEIFLDLARNMPQERFLMILTEENSYRREIVSQAKEIPNLEIKSLVPFSEIHQYFQSAKTYILTSRAEGFPNTIIQSCLSGTPVLSWEFDPDNILSEYKIGFNAECSMDKTIKFFDELSSERFNEYQENCLDYVKTRHSLKNAIKLYKKLFQDLLKKK